MQCSCIPPADMPGSSKLYLDLIQHFDRVQDLYPYAPNNLDSIAQAAKFQYPAERRAALVAALKPLNPGNPSLAKLAEPDTVAIVTGQQVGLFSGPSYTVYKALSAIRIAEALEARGIPAVPVFWLATEDHDFAEVDHAWVFGGDHQPVKVSVAGASESLPRPVGNVAPAAFPLAELKQALAGLPFADDAAALVEDAWRPGETMGSAFARIIRALFEPYGLLLIDPMDPAIRQIAAPLVRDAVLRMPELADALITRSKELVDRGYHAQVLVDQKTSLVFLLENGQRIALKRAPSGDIVAPHRRFSLEELADHASELSPNALLRPVLQDYVLPTAAYVGGPAELAYLAQSRVVYDLLGRHQPAATPRSGFTLIDERANKRMTRYGLRPTDLFTRDLALKQHIAGRLVPPSLHQSLDQTTKTVATALDGFAADLGKFDTSLAEALKTSRRKIEYQVTKIARKTASGILARDAQATADAAYLSGLVYPETHLQERLYSIVPFIAKFGPGLISELHDSINVECPDHQFAVV